MNTQNIGNYLRSKREQNGWTQEEFAELVNVSDRQVRNWEKGAFSSIKNENLDQLSRVLRVSISEIFMGKDMSGLDEETKALLDQEIKGLNERVDSVQTITIKVEDRGLLSMELGVCAFGISIFAVALAWWAASPRTPLISIICLLLGLFGIGFLICGKRVVSRLTKRAKKERDQQSS